MKSDRKKCQELRESLQLSGIRYQEGTVAALLTHCEALKNWAEEIDRMVAGKQAPQDIAAYMESRKEDWDKAMRSTPVALCLVTCVSWPCFLKSRCVPKNLPGAGGHDPCQRDSQSAPA